jgi:hypothetical protein
VNPSVPKFGFLVRQWRKEQRRSKRRRASCAPRNPETLLDYSQICGYPLLKRFGKQLQFKESLRKGQADSLPD